MRLAVAVGFVALMLAQWAMAWKPSGWVYQQYPWAYDSGSAAWFWFNPDTQWVYGYPPAEGWRRLSASTLASGWVYYAWPFAYAQNGGAWHWFNGTDVQWVVNMSGGAWSRMGVPTVPVYMRGIRRVESRLEDVAGNLFRHLGVAIEDPEVIVLVRQRSLPDVVRDVVERFPGINTIRAPLHPDGTEGCAGFAANPDAYIANYVLPLVAATREANVRLILSYHAVQDWSPALLDSDIKPFWGKVIATLDPHDTHVCAELFNEAINPADWPSWRDEFAQPLVDWFNRVAPQLFPLISSPRWCQFFPAEAASAPVTGNYGYVIHPYPGHGTTTEDWEAAFGHIADIAPVVATEWGFEESSPMGQAHLIGGMDYYNGLTAWLDARRLGSVAWLYSSSWEPRMLTDDGASFSSFGAAAHDYYQSAAGSSGDTVIHEGGWSITKPGSASHSTVEVLSLDLQDVSEICIDYSGSSSAVNKTLMPGFIRVRFLSDGTEEEIIRQTTLPYGPLNDHNGPTTNGVFRFAVYPPADGQLRVELGHSNWRTHVHECRISMGQFIVH
jgi:hypothetical protein